MTKYWLVVVLAGVLAVVGTAGYAQEAAPAAGQAAVSEAPAPPASPTGEKVGLPCKIYGDCADTGELPFIPSGYMGDGEDGVSVEADDCCKDAPRAGETCLKITYTKGSKGWAGIAWLNPANNWGDEEGGINLTGAKKLVFWAKGDKGTEMPEFGFGGIAKNKPYWDTAKATTGKVKLTKEWQKFEIPLESKDMNRIVLGFKFSMKGSAEPTVIYLDDISYE